MFDILPENGLDRSILLPVLVGLGYTTLFTEVFGWTFVALVVPGYLSAVLIAAPVSGLVMVLEAVLSYFLARLLALWLPQQGHVWLVFFGRDRFYLIIVASVFVRLMMEGFVLPAVASLYSFRQAGELFSIGLVIVPLTANAFWNVGFVRGLRRTGTITCITWGTLVYIVMPLVNLNLSYFEFTYESVALNFLDSPKAYLLILIGAVFGARTNLRFGWDYNGILVPGLLAVAWYTPLKLVSTLIEAVVLAWIAQRLVTLPPLNRVLMEGPRRTLYVFSLGLVSKFVVGHVAGVFGPGMSATDLYGFGYVLPALVAVKIWQKRNAPRVLIPAVTVSFLAFLSGNVVGYALHLVMPGDTTEASRVNRVNDASAAPPTYAALSEQDARWAVVQGTAWPLRRSRDPVRQPNAKLIERVSHILRGLPFTPPSSELPFLEYRFETPDGVRWTLFRNHLERDPLMPLVLVQEGVGARGIALRTSDVCGMDAATVLSEARSRRTAVMVVGRTGDWLQGFSQVLAMRTGLKRLAAEAAEFNEGLAPPRWQHEGRIWEERALLSAHRARWRQRSYRGSRVPSVEDLRCFSSQLAPWIEGTTTEEVPGVSAHRRALADRLGFSLVRSDSGRAVMARGRGGLLWLRRDRSKERAPLPEAVVVPSPEQALGSVEAAWFLRETRAARDLLVAGEANVYRPDGADLPGTRSYQQRAAELLLGGRDTRLVVLRGLPTHHELHGIDLVLTDGVLGAGPESVWKHELRDVLARTIGTAFEVDGSRSLFPLRGTGEPILRYANQFAPGRVMLVWWASRSRLLALERFTEQPGRTVRKLGRARWGEPKGGSDARGSSPTDEISEAAPALQRRRGRARSGEGERR